MWLDRLELLFIATIVSIVSASNIESFDWHEAHNLIMNNDRGAIEHVKRHINERPSCFLERLSFQEWETLQLCRFREPCLKDLHQDELCSLNPKVGKYLVGCIPHFSDALIFPTSMIREIFIALSSAPRQPAEFYHQIPFPWIAQCRASFLIATQMIGGTKTSVFKELLFDQYKALFQNISPEDCSLIMVAQLKEMKNSVFDLIGVDCLAQIPFSNELLLTKGLQLPAAWKPYLNSEYSYWRDAKEFNEHETGLIIKRFRYRPLWFVSERGFEFFSAVAKYFPDEWPKVAGDLSQIEVNNCRTFWLNLPLAIFPHPPPDAKIKFSFNYTWKSHHLLNVKNLIPFFPVNVDTGRYSLRALVNILNYSWEQMKKSNNNNEIGFHPINAIPLDLFLILASSSAIKHFTKEMFIEIEPKRLFLIDVYNHCSPKFFTSIKSFSFYEFIFLQQKKFIDEGRIDNVNENHSLYGYFANYSKNNSFPVAKQVSDFMAKRVQAKYIIESLNISHVQEKIPPKKKLFTPLLNEYFEAIALFSGHGFVAAERQKFTILHDVRSWKKQPQGKLMNIKEFTPFALSIFVSQISVLRHILPLPLNLAPYPSVQHQDIYDMRSQILIFKSILTTMESNSVNSKSFKKHELMLNIARIYNPMAFMSYFLHEGILEYYEDGFIRFAFGLDKSITFIIGFMFGVILMGGDKVIDSSPFDFKLFRLASPVAKEEAILEYFNEIYIDKLTEFESFLSINGREEFCEFFEFKNIETLVPKTLTNDPRYFPEELHEKPINSITLEQFNSEYIPAFRKRYFEFFREALEDFYRGVNLIMDRRLLITLDYSILSSPFRYYSLFDPEYLLKNCEFDKALELQSIDGIDNKKYKLPVVIDALIKSISSFQLSRFFLMVTGWQYPTKHEKFRILFHRLYDFETEQKVPVVGPATLIQREDVQAILRSVLSKLKIECHFNVNISLPVKRIVASTCSRTIFIPHQSPVDTILSFISFLNSSN